jgi:hypothetical protein
MTKAAIDAFRAAAKEKAKPAARKPAARRPAAKRAAKKETK